MMHGQKNVKLKN